MNIANSIKLHAAIQKSQSADARLIAAAPDLLAALHTLLHDIKCRGHYISDHAVWAAQQAIARATGEAA